ncbi:MAG: ABC transporter ATP-binding protein [Proteobacteria bacterium]|nr:ABC transporter ATP-binding protein [Pseudomonadota bacterium]MDA0952552.1 ABC transporter ATP-binding protein [Pseudomonadota bacterium]
MPDLAIDIAGLTKTYGKGPKAKQALKGIDLQVPRGAFFGLLGPNGAGKSTLINILAGLVIKSGGDARIWDWDITRNPREAKRSIGVVPQELNIDPFFTPREAMELQAGLYGVPRKARKTDEILAAVGLSDQADTYARRLSGGMRRRLLVAKAMVHSPPVIVLDEPTAGVDVELRRSFWAYIRTLNQAGVTILLTTHYLEEAERFCDEIAIINHGELIVRDTPAGLKRRLDSKILMLRTEERIDALPETLQGLDAKVTPNGRLQIRYRPSEAQVDEVLARIRAAGLTIADLSTTEGDLEDIFVALTSDRPTPPAEAAE